MDYIEEQYARQLYQNLQTAFSNDDSSLLSLLGQKPWSGQELAVSLEGAGVHWHCTATKETRSCHIHCFDIDLANFAYKGPEYYIKFEANGQTEATGRTFNQQETIAAASGWLQEQPLEKLYHQLAFLDIEKRKLRTLLAELTTTYPALGEIQQGEIIDDCFLSPALYFKNGDRGCCVECVDYDHHMQYSFTWDGSAIFEATEADTTQIRELVNKWVVEAAMPSVLAVDFPAVDFGYLAPYYERGAGLEGEFRLSWDETEAFYQQTKLAMQADVLELLQQMRAKGFDKTLRAGHSLYTLLLSRSRWHGLRAEQTAIVFSFGTSNSHPSTSAMRVALDDLNFTFDRIEYNELLEDLLGQLQRQLID